MKLRKTLALLISIAMASSIALTGCTKKGDVASLPDVKQGKIDKDQTLRLLGYDITSLDPTKVSDQNTLTAYTHIYSGLVREVSENGVVKNILDGAEKMDVSSDKLKYTFTLKDTKWSDGKPVTAKDYEFAWKRLNDPKISTDYVSFLSDIGVKNAKAIADGKMPTDQLGVKALDEKTFEVQLETPTPYFESALSFKLLVPQREDIVTKLGDMYGTDYVNMVYNGPFKLTEYQKGTKIVYEKNDSYWDAKNIQITKIEAPIVEERLTVEKMFDNKEVDSVEISGDELKDYINNAKNGAYQYNRGIDPAIYYLTFNCNSKYLSNAKVRKALSISFDRQKLLDDIYQRYTPAYGLIPNKIAVGDKEYRSVVPEELKNIKDNPKDLLKQGLDELGIKDPSQVKLTLWSQPINSINTKQAEFFKSQWEKNIGINVEIKYAQDDNTYWKIKSSGTEDITISGWGADYNDVNSFFQFLTSESGNNSGSYSNPEYDKLIADASKELDVNKRIELYKKAEELAIVEDAAIAPTDYSDLHLFTRNYVKNLYRPLFGGLYDARDAYIQGKEAAK